MRGTWSRTAALAMVVLARPAASEPPAAAPCPAGMVSVPAGRFRIGDPASPTVRAELAEVALPAYCIDRTEVTVKAYAACVAAKGCTPSPLTVMWDGFSPDGAAPFSRYCNGADRPEHPINCVDWSQAAAYCAWAGKRLPTDEEWEYAALGDDGRIYPWGDAPPSADRLNACGSECVALGRTFDRSWAALYQADDGWAATAPVGSFPAGESPFGALDMAGNVWEWTADWSAARAMQPPPRYRATRRVQRGGGWSYDGAGATRTAVRFRIEPPDRSSDVGFRCARSR